MGRLARVLAVPLFALTATDGERIDQIRELRRAGASWTEVGRALIVADEAEIGGLRREGLAWREIRKRTLERETLRDAPASVPASQDENRWRRGGFQEPGAGRERAPGQPGTIRPPEHLLPPGGQARPGGPDEPRPMLPE